MSTDPLFEADDAATPLTPEEKLGLMPSYITLRRELNEAEQINVTRAEQWAFSRKRDVLNEAYRRRLHKQMFQDVWTWAGEFRTSPSATLASSRGVLSPSCASCWKTYAIGSRIKPTRPTKLRRDFVTSWCGFIVSRTVTAAMGGSRRICC